MNIKKRLFLSKLRTLLLILFGAGLSLPIIYHFALNASWWWCAIPAGAFVISYIILPDGFYDREEFESEFEELSAFDIVEQSSNVNYIFYKLKDEEDDEYFVKEKKIK